MEKAKDLEQLVKVLAENVGMGQSVRYELDTLAYGVLIDFLDISGEEYVYMSELTDNLEEKLKDWQLELIMNQREALTLPNEINPPRTGVQFEWMRDFANRSSKLCLFPI